MGPVSLVRLGDQRSVEPLLAAARLVAGDKQDCLSLWIKRESNAPYAAIGVEPELLHIGEGRSLRVSACGRLSWGAKHSQQSGKSQDFILDRLRQRIKLRIELVAKSDFPRHIASKLYSSKKRRAGGLVSVSTSGDRQKAGEGGFPRPLIQPVRRLLEFSTVEQPLDVASYGVRCHDERGV